MQDDKFDAIIVGAGLAGSTAALLLAQQGLQVVLIERGPYPGSKNLSGGILYGRVLEGILPNYWEEAPIERPINNYITTFMTPEGHFNLDYKSQAYAQAPYNGVTILRAKFDRWLAGKAEAAGAMLVPGIKVEKVLWEDSRVVGIVAGEDEMRADVIIAADGANSFIAQEAGLRGRIPTEQVAVGVKEVVALPRQVIEERFHLAPGEGAAYSIVGFATRGVAGGGFLYTNLDSLSIGLVINLQEILKSRLNPADILEDFLAHPMIAPLVKDGTLMEYGAHLVPEGGVEMMPRLYTSGMVVVGDAAGLSINNGFVVRGMDLAIGSAQAAAEAILEARAKGDFSSEGLRVYQQKLEASYVMADMRTYSRAPEFMLNERMFKAYPEMLVDIMNKIYCVDARPKEHLLPYIMKSMKDNHISVWDVTKDGISGARAL